MRISHEAVTERGFDIGSEHFYSGDLLGQSRDLEEIDVRAWKRHSSHLMKSSIFQKHIQTNYSITSTNVPYNSSKDF